MSQFSFKDYIFTHLFPPYFKIKDTYRDENGKGILERFIDVCAEYFDEVKEPIDNFMDILDIDKTPYIFLNYFWEYFGYIPYAYGALIGNSEITNTLEAIKENPNLFPRADARKILKYAISLYKIRGTQDFYTILGRFYGIDIKITRGTGGGGGDDKYGDTYQVISDNPNDTLDKYSGTYRKKGEFIVWDENPNIKWAKIKFGDSSTQYQGYALYDYSSGTPVSVTGNKLFYIFTWPDYSKPIYNQLIGLTDLEPPLHTENAGNFIWVPGKNVITGNDIDKPIVMATYGGVFAMYDNVKAGYTINGGCGECVYFKVEIHIPKWLADLIDQQAQENPKRWDEIQDIFTKIIEKYLPIYSRIKGGHVDIIKDGDPTLQVLAPPYRELKQNP